MTQRQCNLIIDSPAELPKSFCDANDVTVLHFSYTEADDPEGGLSGVDDMFESRSAHDFYEAMRKGAQPMTSQPSQLEFETAFREAIESGVPTVYLAFDSGISGCYEGALTALERVREDLGKKGRHAEFYIVDTKLPSTPLNLLAWEAVRQRDNGLTAKQLADWASEAHFFIHTLFMVDDLKALAHGGRIPSGVASIGTALNIKPLLSVDLDGKLTFAGVARGRKKGLRRLAENYLKHHDPSTFMVAIGNADCQHDARTLQDLIEKGCGEALVLESNIGPTIGSHVGPAMVSCCFWGDDRRENLPVPDQIASGVKSK